MKQLLTVPEAMVVAKCSRATIYRWVDQNRIRHEHGASGLLVHARDVTKAATTTRRGRPRKIREK